MLKIIREKEVMEEEEEEVEHAEEGADHLSSFREQWRQELVQGGQGGRGGQEGRGGHEGQGGRGPEEDLEDDIHTQV